MATRDNGATKFETVRYEPKGAICHIILNRPEKLNAANDQLVEEVNDALFEFDADPELRVVIISGAGRAFCSGADVRQRQLRTRDELKRLGGPAGRRSRENGLGDTVNWKPVIAAVHGYALVWATRSRSPAIWWWPPPARNSRSARCSGGSPAASTGWRRGSGRVAASRTRSR